ncbi:glycogen debranching protein GlgX, partial [Magnetococcales bacterium HHB-1]
YWVEVMHVDGFRFDLTSILGRVKNGAFSTNAAFFHLIQQDPILSCVKWIAEPWDLGCDGYQLGRFPGGWSEWNDRYRDAVRRFWRGDRRMTGEVASCLSGSSDLFNHHGRRPDASINFITAHDGFTLYDLVSYQQKHNHGNLENNRDGTDSNHSWNCGVEGVSDDPEINALREKQRRNLLATLFLSQGVPMLLAGDEFGRTQKGNNNPYCQDNPISWIDWDLLETKPGKALFNFTRKLICLRKTYHAFQRRRFFTGKPSHTTGLKDILWLHPSGKEMQSLDWQEPEAKTFSLLLGEGRPPQTHPQKEAQHLFWLILNACDKAVTCHPPVQVKHLSWQVEVYTDKKNPKQKKEGGALIAPPHTLILLKPET